VSLARADKSGVAVEAFEDERGMAAAFADTTTTDGGLGLSNLRRGAQRRGGDTVIGSRECGGASVVRRVRI
jgi:hypothetical protein